MSEFYKLDENKNVKPCTAAQWAQQLEDMRSNNSKHVADECIGDIRISTVWLGLDHGFNLHNSKNYRPLVFETMVFKDGNGLECYCRRYSTWEEAELGHERAIQWVREGCKESDSENE